MKKPSLAKKIISGILGIIFLIVAIVAIFVCTYIFSQPSKSGDSRELIFGTWIDEEAGIRIAMNKTGEFKLTNVNDKGKNTHTIAKGWFKIDEDNHRIQILLNPKHIDTSFDLGTKLKYFTTISYKNLELPDKDDEDIPEEEKSANCRFIIENTEAVYSCERENYGESFYSGHNN
ncbi:MAG: hypothetical protein IJ571_09395 [Ruminococcus sp.]|nr:hypothetical protein [Ruminococcus sp.]